MPVVLPYQLEPVAWPESSVTYQPWSSRPNFSSPSPILRVVGGARQGAFGGLYGRISAARLCFRL